MYPPPPPSCKYFKISGAACKSASTASRLYDGNACRTYLVFPTNRRYFPLFRLKRRRGQGQLTRDESRIVNARSRARSWDCRNPHLESRIVDIIRNHETFFFFLHWCAAFRGGLHPALRRCTTSTYLVIGIPLSFLYTKFKY